MSWQNCVIKGTEGLFLAMGTYYDVRTKKVPVFFLSFFTGIGMIWNIVWKYQRIETLILGVCFGGVFFAVSKMSREAIGLGDAWGILNLGIFEGWRGAVSLVFAAFLFSSIYGVYKMTIHRKKVEDTMPFFPFLLFALVGGFVA